MGPIITSGLTVAELKDALASWPDTDAEGEPLEVWIETAPGITNQARALWPLNKRVTENGKTLADLLLSPRE